MSRRSAVWTVSLFAAMLSGCATDWAYIRAGNSDDPDTLKEIAMRVCPGGFAINGRSPARKAVERLEDQDALAQVAMKAAQSEVRSTAVGKLTDQSLLGRVALEANSPDDRTAALKKLADPVVLAKVAHKADSEALAKQAVAALDDPALLADVVRESPMASVRAVAVERIDDQQVLTDLAVSGPEDIRLPATKRLHQAEALANVAMQGEAAKVRLEAVHRLSNQGRLREIALKSEDDAVRIAAIGKLTDQSAIKQIALSEATLGVRIAAILRLNDQAALAEIVLSAADSSTALLAAAKISNPKVIADVAAKVTSPPLENCLGPRLDQAAAVRMRDEARSPALRLWGRMMISQDPREISAIAIQTDRGWIAVQAVDRLAGADGALLLRIAREAATEDAQRAAVRALPLPERIPTPEGGSDGIDWDSDEAVIVLRTLTAPDISHERMDTAVALLAARASVADEDRLARCAKGDPAVAWLFCQSGCDAMKKAGEKCLSDRLGSRCKTKGGRVIGLGRFSGQMTFSSFGPNSSIALTSGSYAVGGQLGGAEFRIGDMACEVEYIAHKTGINVKKDHGKIWTVGGNAFVFEGPGPRARLTQIKTRQ